MNMVTTADETISCRSVLMNRLEMAVLFWKFCDFPVRCAITAACLLRKMATNDAVNPIVSETMKDHANYFENLAIAVQTQARKDDRYLATQALNVPLIIWRGMSLLDVTMEARCYRFLEVTPKHGFRENRSDQLLRLNFACRCVANRPWTTWRQATFHRMATSGST